MPTPDQYVTAIKAYMRAHGISQVRLAQKLGVNKGTVSRALREGNTPHAETVAKIATALGTTVPKLLRTKTPPT